MCAAPSHFWATSGGRDCEYNLRFPIPTPGRQAGEREIFLSPEIRFPILWESYDQDPPNRNAVLRSSIQTWDMAFADFSTFEREFGGL